MPDTLHNFTEKFLRENLDNLQGSYIADGLAQIVPVFEKARSEGANVFFLGNGGSATTASHMACDLGKSTIKQGRNRLRCMALSEAIGTITAWANDFSYADIFAEQLRSIGRPGDVVVGISGSGNSPNVLKALEVAKSMGMRTIGLIGSGGGKMKPLCEISIVVPSHNMGHIEDVHLLINHALTEYLRDHA